VDEGGQIGLSSGEYVIQDGFGWSNGIVLELLQLYNSTVSIKNWEETAKICSDVLKKLIISKNSNNDTKVDHN